ncbi:T-lymphocyte surface antigen Ly-9 [Labeo rohita]|uniref:T-lymphocyte surface antigen Ly-9 n=1 Tax=Labeo rohita TaxID=84645 RepID=UPI0021E28B2F|nr:T-lymphocyte surface antigen Ly-9 [Labeo rohita]
MPTSQRAMSLCRIVLLSIVCIHHVCGTDIYITGYRGDSVILTSGADRSWNLTRVQWSIYKNTTYIASLKDGEVTIYKFWRHQGRLDLNKETGDLTIKNLTMDDTMMYIMALVTSSGIRTQVKVHLSVQERLQIQVTQKLHSLNDNKCHVVLECATHVQNVNFSWMPDGEFNGSYISGITKSVNSSSVLYASFSVNRIVTFNCTGSSGQQTVTNQVTVGCSEEKQKCDVCTVCSSCSSCVSSVMWTFVLTAAFVWFLAYVITRNQEKIIAACSEVNQRIRTTSFRTNSRGVQGKQENA